MKQEGHSMIRGDNRAGFTIVELLIVIVVIAILAAISVVAYTGIQERANVSRVQSELRNIAQMLSVYNIDNSGYPDDVLPVRASGIKGAVSSTNGSDAMYCGTPEDYRVFMRLDSSAGSRQFEVGPGVAPQEVISRRGWGANGLCVDLPSDRYALWYSYW